MAAKNNHLVQRKGSAPGSQWPTFHRLVMEKNIALKRKSRRVKLICMSLHDLEQRTDLNEVNEVSCNWVFNKQISDFIGAWLMFKCMLINDRKQE